MDDTLTELENELKALSPLRPSTALQTRIAQELDAPAHAAALQGRYTSATTFRSWKWLGWQLAAAAAVALTVSLGVWRWQRSKETADKPAETFAAIPITPVTSMPETRDRYRPVGATNVLYDLKDEGPASLADNTPARRMRYRYVDTYTWKNPAGNASLKWSVPRDEVRVVPASLH